MTKVYINHFHKQAVVFFGEKNSVCNFDGQFFSVSDICRKNILKALYAL